MLPQGRLRFLAVQAVIVIHRVSQKLVTAAFLHSCSLFYYHHRFNQKRRRKFIISTSFFKTEKKSGNKPAVIKIHKFNHSTSVRKSIGPCKASKLSSSHLVDIHTPQGQQCRAKLSPAIHALPSVEGAGGRGGLWRAHSKGHLFADVTPSKTATEPCSQTNFLLEIKKKRGRGF